MSTSVLLWSSILGSLILHSNIKISTDDSSALFSFLSSLFCYVCRTIDVLYGYNYNWIVCFITNLSSARSSYYLYRSIILRFTVFDLFMLVLDLESSSKVCMSGNCLFRKDSTEHHILECLM